MLLLRSLCVLQFSMVVQQAVRATVCRRFHRVVKLPVLRYRVSADTLEEEGF
jgi:hypothetical protein